MFSILESSIDSRIDSSTGVHTVLDSILEYLEAATARVVSWLAVTGLRWAALLYAYLSGLIFND
jgi:hypothetical protein